MVCPTPQTTSTTPEVPATYHWPFTCITSSMCTSSGMPFLKRMAACFDTERKVASRSKGEGGNDAPPADLKPALYLQLRVRACGEIREELADGRSHPLLLDADRRI